MKIKLFACFICISVGLIIVSWNVKHKYVKNENQLIIPQKDGTLTLTVFSSKIIHVTFEGKGSHRDRDELVVTKIPERINWKVKTEQDVIFLETDEVIAKIDTLGTVRFFNKNDDLLLSELPGGRKLKLTAVQGKQSFSPEQEFESKDEGLYGIGQFQNGLMNWKNVPLRLKQYNQEIIVPYLVSTKGYGLLWNNYSVTEFNPAEHVILLNEVVDTIQNVRKSSFTPTKTGVYSFAIESINLKENRFSGPVLLTIDSDTVVYYNTTWVPDFHSGKKELKAGKTYEVVLTNSNTKNEGSVVYNEPDYNKTVFRSQLGNQIDYYFVYGGNLEGVISKYRDLTGQAPLFGKWAYGFWQCRERYHSQSELLENAKEYRKRNIPVDNIVQDWNYWPDKTWGPEWNRKLYPDPKAMCQELKSLDFHLMVSVWPCVRNKKLEEKYGLTPFKLDTVSGNLDFYNPQVRSSYYQMLKDSMFSLGVNSIWLDGTEPEVYPINAISVLGAYDNYALTYSLPVTQSVYEGHRKDYPEQRVFNLTRSAFAGQQRYAAACWSGDVKGTWQQFAEQIPAGLNYSMAGLPYWTTDIGGFFRDSKSMNPIYDDQYSNPEYKELLTRWFQFGTFCPIFRIHGYVSETEIWRYGAPFEKMAREYIDLRYRLMPYIYSLAWQVSDQGAIIMKPLVHDYPSDKNTWGIKDQFLFGSSVLVNPVIQYKSRSRNLYLPEGNWFNFYTNELFSGGRNVKVSAPLDQMPLFIKAGSIIPVGPRIQHAMQPFTEPLEVFVYPGHNVSFLLYEDEGESYRYEHGRYSTISMKWNENSKTLTLGKRQGKFSEMPISRQFKIILVGSAGGSAFDQNSVSLITYDGEEQSIKL